MSLFELDQPESVATSGGNYLALPGSYHLMVTAIEDNPTKKDGSPLDAVRVQCNVLAGTTEGCAGSIYELLLWKPTLKSKNNGEWQKKILARFFLAVNVMRQHQAGQRVAIDTTKAIGQQFVAKLALKDKENSDEKRLELNFADIYHIDDPAVERVPKDLQSLALITKENRKKPEDFADSKPVKSAPKPSAVVSAVAIGSAASTSTGPAINLDDF